MNILEKIMAERRRDVEQARQRVPLERLLERARSRRHHSLAESLRTGSGPRIVAELKKASPSAGLLRPDYRPAVVARRYEAAGAAAISVLTEPRHFLGSVEHLCEVRRAVALPVLRKDFVCDAYQLAEAAAWGADVVLLIVAALDAGTLRRLYEAGREQGLDVLVESHTREELDVALQLEEAIVGVNNRDLKTLKTDIGTALSLARAIPGDRLSVAESGIRTAADVASLAACGYRGFLVGETLMAADDPADRLQALLGKRAGDD